MSDSELISALKKRIEFDEKPAQAEFTLWRNKPNGKFPERGHHYSGYYNYAMPVEFGFYEGARWQSEQLQPVLLAMVSVVNVAVMEHNQLDHESDMAKALARLKEAVEAE